jgi:flagellar motility protein MotE (MotC chaperone)
MKSILPYLLLMTGTLVAALAIIAGVYYVRPQLLGVAPKSAQPVAIRDSAGAKSPLAGTAQKSGATGGKSDSTEVQPDSTFHGTASLPPAKGDAALLLADSIRTLISRIDDQQKTIARLTANSARPDSLPKGSVSDSARAKDSKSFAKMLETMPAEQAVRILKGLDDREVKAVLLAVKKRQASKILSALDPERAARMMRTMQ